MKWISWTLRERNGHCLELKCWDRMSWHLDFDVVCKEKNTSIKELFSETPHLKNLTNGDDDGIAIWFLDPKILHQNISLNIVNKIYFSILKICKIACLLQASIFHWFLVDNCMRCTFFLVFYRNYFSVFINKL